MNIQQKPAYWIGQIPFPTIQEAQRQELSALISQGGVLNDSANSVIERILENADEVVDILTCKPKSKEPRKTRKDKGVPRKKVEPATP
jgi:hypothetical protein